MKATFQSLSLVVAIGLLSSGCVSYSRTERTVPAPAPATVVERPVYVERPVQPATFDPRAFRTTEDCLNAASAAQVPVAQCR